MQPVPLRPTPTAAAATARRLGEPPLGQPVQQLAVDGGAAETSMAGGDRFGALGGDLFFLFLVF